jgi:hypothetical protein
LRLQPASGRGDRTRPERTEEGIERVPVATCEAAHQIVELALAHFE